MYEQSKKSEAEETREIGIGGMTCDRCAQRVDQVLRGVPGVKHVRVDLSRAVASVTFDSTATRISALHEALLQGGYTPTTLVPSSGAYL